jgi:hypothetical protein
MTSPWPVRLRRLARVNILRSRFECVEGGRLPGMTGQRRGTRKTVSGLRFEILRERASAAASVRDLGLLFPQRGPCLGPTKILGTHRAKTA